MKKMNLMNGFSKTLQLFLCGTLVVFVFISCKKEPKSDFPLGNPTMHAETLGKYLEDTLGPGCVGMQYAIVKGGNLALSKAIGKIGLPSNGVDIDYSTLHRKSVHSGSKTITAATLVYMLNLYGVSIDTNIADFLPDGWSKVDLENKNVTFRELLTHKSGLRDGPSGDTYEKIKDYVEAGVFSSKNEVYANVNFTLMRILIPNISATEHSILEGIYRNKGEVVYALEVAERYIDYVRKWVLEPAGVNKKVAPKIWDAAQFPTPTYNYNFADQTVAGYSHTDQTLKTGAGGWYLNAKEYAAFLTYLINNQFPKVTFDEMGDDELGMYRGVYNGVEHYTHNGASPDRADGCGGRFIWVYMPVKNTIVVVQVNSANNTFTNATLKDIIIDGAIEATY